jgi:tRNA(Ile)-lysidine synthase
MPNSLISPQSISSYFTPNSTVIIGFSGGPDSVCLLHLLSKIKSELNLRIIAAHLDHGWRKESALDATWCKNTCKELGIEFVTSKASDLNYTPKYNGSKEELGRKLRRYFFDYLAHEYQANAIILAHHADDQIETFFIRLLRGSSLSGISGIRTQDGLYVRPLLNYHKSDILNYLKKEDVSYLEDSTNFEQNFLRNRIRLNLLPMLGTIDARWQKTIPSCITQLQQTDNFLNKHCQKIMLEISDQHNSDHIHIQRFLEIDEILQHRIILRQLIKQKIQFTPTTALFHEILRFLMSNQANKHTINQKTALVKKDGYFYFQLL